MLGFFAAIYSGITFLFACIGVAFVAYKLYQSYFKRDTNTSQLNQQFENIRRERLQREEAVSQHVIQSNQLLQENAEQVVARFKDQQAHLEKFITDFDLIIAQTQYINNDLNETSSSFQNRVIIPMQALLTRIKAHFQEASSLVSRLAEAMTNATQSISEREKELKVAIENMAKSQANISSAVEQLPKVNLCAQYLVKLEQRNHDLEKQLSEVTTALVALTSQSEKLLEIKSRQQRLIECLKKQNPSHVPSHDCRLFGARSSNTSRPTDSEDETVSNYMSAELRTDTTLMV